MKVRAACGSLAGAAITALLALQSQLMFSQSSPAQDAPAPAASPSSPAVQFEAATIKPVKNPEPGNIYDREDGRHFLTHDTTLLQLILMAYHLDKRQVIGLPDWATTEEYDIDAVAESDQQLRLHFREMLQALLADRFQLTFHREQRDMPAYLLTVAKGGPKMTPAKPDEGQESGCQRLAQCTFRHEDPQHLASWLQLVVVDRPVIDRTGLATPYDFTLRWTPDESQFTGLGIRVPAATANDPNGLPGLFTAVEEQLGLKLIPERVPVEVLMLDRAARPTAD